MSDDSIVRYVAEKALEDIRASRALPSALAHALHRQPYIEVLRGKVVNEDIPHLLTGVRQDTDQEMRVLCLSLLKDRESSDEVRNCFMDLWSTGLGYEMRRTLMWRVLDDPSLNINTHRECYQFVTENWDLWISDLSRWHGGPANVVGSVRQRLTDVSTPRTKDWAYLCVLAGSDDATQAKEIIRKYTSSEQSVVGDVAHDMLKRLESETECLAASDPS